MMKTIHYISSYIYTCTYAYMYTHMHIIIYSHTSYIIYFIIIAPIISVLLYIHFYLQCKHTVYFSVQCSTTTVQYSTVQLQYSESVTHPRHHTLLHSSPYCTTVSAFFISVVFTVFLFEYMSV